MTPHRPQLRRGFTLLEAMVAVMILAIIAAVVSPVVTSASDLYVQSMAVRRKSERVAFAVERCVRFIREIPLGAVASDVAITTAAADQIVLESGAAIEFDGSELVLVDTHGTRGQLCGGVETFTMQFLASDGVTSTTATPGQTRRINITLRAEGFELTSSAFIRSGASL